MHIPPPPFLGKGKANFLIHLSHFFSVSTAQYAHYVFNAIDRDSNGSVSFEVIFLSNLFLRYHLCLWQWCHFASPPPFASSLIIMHVPYMPPTFLWTHRAFPSIKEKIKEEKSDKMKTVSFCCFHWAEKEELNRLELKQKREEERGITFVLFSSVTLTSASNTIDIPQTVNDFDFCRLRRWRAMTTSKTKHILHTL